MHFVIIFGPPAVGKMTVGKELAKITGFKLFHNHLSIELALNFFEYGTPEFNKINSGIRDLIFNTVAKSELKGFIFTFVWAFNLEADKKYIEHAKDIFEKENWITYFVELECELEERLKRNVSETRIKEKPSKRSLKESEKRLHKTEQKYVLNTQEEFYFPENYIKINNTALSAKEVARMIKIHFSF